MPRIRDTYVFNTTNGASDVAVANGAITFGTWGRKILFNELNRESKPYVKIPYTAGTPKVMTIKITGTVSTTFTYRFVLRLWQNAAAGQLINPDVRYNQEVNILVTASSATASALAAALNTEINRRYNDGSLPISSTNSTDTNTLTASNALFNFTIESPDIAATITETTAWVEPSGSYDEVVKINPKAQPGGTYDKHIFRSIVQIPGFAGQSIANQEVCDIVFVKNGITNKAALDQKISDVMGIDNYVGTLTDAAQKLADYFQP